MQGIGAGVRPQDGQQMRPASPEGEMEANEKPGAGPEQDDADEMGGNVSPEEQALYEQVVKNAAEIIYPPNAEGQMSPAVVAHLKGQYEDQAQQMFAKAEPPLDPGSPIDNIAASAVMIVMYVDASAQQAGKDISADILQHAGAEVVQLLGNDGEKFAGFDVSDKDIEQAYYRAVDLFRQISPRADQQGLADEFGQLVEADKAGQLDQMMSGKGAAMQQGQA